MPSGKGRPLLAYTVPMHPSLRRFVFLGFAFAALGCGDETSTDAAPRDAATEDAAPPVDAGHDMPDVDLGAPDLGAADLGFPDDLGARDMGAADAGPDDLGTPDAGPEDMGSPVSPAECFEGWATLPAGTCAAPIIDESWVGEGCVGTDGWFISGANFQLRERRTGVADRGPQSIGVNGDQSHWNVIEPNLLCVTIYRGYADTWAGHDVYVVNPDGQSSNTVTIQNRF